MKCPNCGHAMTLVMGDTLECEACALYAPRDVLEALAARSAPAGVLAEAERLMCSVGICVFQPGYDGEASATFVDGDVVAGATLAEAYATIEADLIAERNDMEAEVFETIERTRGM